MFPYFITALTKNTIFNNMLAVDAFDFGNSNWSKSDSSLREGDSVTTFKSGLSKATLFWFLMMSFVY